MTNPAPSSRTASEIVAAIADGASTPSRVLQEHLATIDEREDAVHAWAFVDREAALDQAHKLDNSAAPRGVLHGVPFGTKDNIDSADTTTWP